jgi:hypothetical protein
MKKNLLILFYLLIFPLAGYTRPAGGIDLPVTGFIDITVESNINKVDFTYPISSSNVGNREEKSIADITVPVKDFRCKNKIAFRDFLTLLKANEYPDIKITIPGNIIEQLQGKESVTLHNVLINIAGVTKKYDIVCTSSHNKDNILTGTIVVRLNDLNIDPPEKYLGMVKIKDQVIVKFGLGIQDYSFARK